MPVESISIRQKTVEVEVKSSGQKIVVPSSRVQIVTAGKVGPSGPAADASFEWVTQAFELAESQQEFILDFEPRTGSVFVYLNGLLERFWAIADLTVTLDDSALAGDSVVISYQKEI